MIRIRVLEPEKLKPYQDISPSIIKKFGGRILTHGGEVTTLEGPEETRRIVMLEFPTIEMSKAFFSVEYQKAIELRKEAAEFEMIVVESLE